MDAMRKPTQPGADPISHADPIAKPSYLRLQASVFALVSAAFVNIYITQPVLPVLQQEFAADMVAATCERLVAGGAPGLHFYTLNLAKPTQSVLVRLAG